MLKNFISKLPLYYSLLFKFYLLNLFLFFLVRLFFYIVNQAKNVNDVPFSELLLAFKIGLEFDTAVICWIVFIPLIIWSLAWCFSSLRLYKIGFYLFLILQVLYHFIAVANIPYYHQFGNHLNDHAFLWIENPSFVIGLIFGSVFYWGYLILFVFIATVLVIVSFYFFNSFKKKLQKENTKNKYHVLFLFILFLGITSIGARGRIFERSGLQEGIAIVSQNTFINQLAINPNFTFWKSVILSDFKKQYQVPINIEDDIRFTQNYLGIKSPLKTSINRQIVGNTTLHKYNFIIVIMESMCRFNMGYYNGKNLTPYLHQLNEESIFFENFFSSGIHTFNGLFSVSSGYPGIYAEHALKSYVKQPFDGIGKQLKSLGYETYFYTTHDANFDNMKGFFTLNHFQHFISENDFSFSERESALGVPDHLLLNKLIEITNDRKSDKPFLQVVMTASNHGPWKIPENIPFKPNGENPQENCLLYSDWSIGKFITEAKKTKWNDNTVFIFLGDHGLSLGHTYEMPLSYHHIPCTIHQPKLFKPDTIFSPCYQPDIPATVMGIIGSSYTNSSFGLDILKEEHSFVVFSADDKIGCVDKNGYYFYRTLNNGNTYLRKYKNMDPVNYKFSYNLKADSMDRNMMNIYRTAEFFLKKNYFLYK